MPKRKQAKWGHRGRYLFHMDPPTTYSTATINALAKSFGISAPTTIASMKNGLEGAASIYRTYKQNHDTAPNAKQIRSALNTIESLVTRLNIRLETMDDWTARLFWQGAREVDNCVWDENFKKSRFGHTIEREKLSEKESVIFYLEPRYLFQALEILKNYSIDARARIPRDTGGRSSSESLRMWAFNIQKLWQEALKRPFTIDYHRGKPVSEAARFCVAAFKPIDPAIPARQIITAARKAVTSGRQWAGKNPTPKKG